ncbi:MAG: helix-turn-helix transcriptional regulator [Mobilitalea sp.]
MEDKKKFGEYIIKRRKELGLTQKELANKLFVTESAVSKWERGLSYPDITLIRDLCNILSISEHELLTAGEDMETKNTKKLAKRYLNIVKVLRNVQILLYGLTLLICFICNLAVQHKLSWFFIVLTSVLVSMSLTLLPVMVTKKKGLITLGAFTGSLSLLLLTCNIYTGGNWFLVTFASVIFGLLLLFLPFILYSMELPDYFKNKKTLIYFAIISLLLILLLYVCNAYVGGDWFLSIAVPITVYSLMLLWGMMLVIRYTKFSIWIKIAGCLTLGSAFHYTVQGFIDYLLKEETYYIGFRFNLIDWSETYVSDNINVIVFGVLLTTAIIFFIAGITIGHKDRSIKEAEVLLK